MSAICGGREGARRTTSVVIQSRASWRAVQRVAKRVTQLRPEGPGCPLVALRAMR